jgi:hypothetical protein
LHRCDEDEEKNATSQYMGTPAVAKGEGEDPSDNRNITPNRRFSNAGGRDGNVNSRTTDGPGGAVQVECSLPIA